MTKRFLVSLSAVAALSTSAMAYDVFPTNEIANMTYASTTTGDGNVTNVTANTMGAISLSNSNQGSLLLFPHIFVGGQAGLNSKIRIINPTNTDVVAKLVIYDAANSKEVKDFNIYLSKNDVWEGTLTKDANGNVYLETSDGSFPARLGSVDGVTYPMATDTADGKITELVDATGNTGTSHYYAQVIEMVDVNAVDSTTGQAIDLHGSDLRRAYFDLAMGVRSDNASITQSDGGYAQYLATQFTNGVINNINGASATMPAADINASAFVVNNMPLRGTTKTANVSFSTPAGSLTGDLIVSGAFPYATGLSAVAYNYTLPTGTYKTTDTTGLFYLEGEKANIADIDISSTNDYDLTGLAQQLFNISPLNVRVPYGDTSNVNNSLVMATIPFKRMLVQEQLKLNNTATAVNVDWDADGANENVITGISYNATTKTIDSYGKVTAYLTIYNNDEGQYISSQFSPASTPAVELTDEAGIVTNINTILSDAAARGFTKGFYTITNNSLTRVPGVFTELKAIDTTDGKFIVNWVKH
jgi:hypothetical protein